MNHVLGVLLGLAIGMLIRWAMISAGVPLRVRLPLYVLIVGAMIYIMAPWEPWEAP